MNDKLVTQTLLLEAHRCVALAAEETATKIGQPRLRPSPKEGSVDTEALLSYPPNGVLSPEEEEAIRSMNLSTVERSALQKLVADGCASAFFHFFNLVDATGDPEVKVPRGTWLGAWIMAPKDDRDRDMLHDGFFESYAEYAHVMRRRTET
jgi:hypothetical protein